MMDDDSRQADQTNATGSVFERQLREDLRAAALDASLAGTPEDVIRRAGERDRQVGRLALAGTATVLIVVALVALPSRSSSVRLDSVAGPGVTETVPALIDPQATPDPPIAALPPDARPEGRLVAGVDGRLVITDLDGRVLEDAAWQPTSDARIEDVVTDGDFVMTWQPPCTLEAGYLSTGQSVEAVGGGTCDGPGALHESTGTIMWIGGPEGTTDGDELTLRDASLTGSSSGAAGSSGLLQPGDRVVAMEDAGSDGTARLLVRRQLDEVEEVMALPLTLVGGRSWEASPEPGGGDGWAPAYSQPDGFVALDSSHDGWVLDVRWGFPQGDAEFGAAEEVRMSREGTGSSLSTGGLDIDTSTVWFDARGQAVIWGSSTSEPVWGLILDVGGAGATAFSGTTTGGVTAAAIIPGSITVPPTLGEDTAPAPTIVPDQPSDAQQDLSWSTPWCGDVPLVAVTTSAGPDAAATAVCFDGTSTDVGGPSAGWSHPSVGGGALALATGESEESAASFRVFGAQRSILGSTPALATTGGLAWSQLTEQGTEIQMAEDVVHLSTTDGGGPPDRIEARVLATFPVSVEVTGLSWGRGGRWLFGQSRGEDGAVAAWAVDTINDAVAEGADSEDVLTPILPPEGHEVLAVTGELDTIGAGVLLTSAPDGTVAVSGVLMAGAATPYPEPRVTQLGTVTGDVAASLSAAVARPTIAATSLLTPQAAGGWAQGRDISWLVGDGTRAWHLPSLGEPTLVFEDVAEVAVNPLALGY